MADFPSAGSLEPRAITEGVLPDGFAPLRRGFLFCCALGQVIGLRFAMRLDLFGLSLIQFRQLVAGLSFGPQQLIELCVDGLRIPVFGALDEKRHDPGRERGDAVPI
jgi:hypothetical protein